ncbi:hypothetical protein BCR44DRAFT_95586 [Catenaria anguillulae PL171]|uniref:Transmembrane protein n=1 Tax=Catenaria anguillulae PL171 TaxID=765915 RepID=A0A1Y2HHJ6_9FUNG|nr:hypothetical protein BCR44DRAFT_95586 [Catenaria anguillulae PL171]
MSSDPTAATAASDDLAGLSPAERRAEARRRRMMQKPEDRLARIKALSTGQELPPLSTVVGGAADEAKPDHDEIKRETTTDDVVKANTPAPAPAPMARKPAATASSTAEPSIPRQRKPGAATAARVAKPAGAVSRSSTTAPNVPTQAQQAPSGLINPLLGQTPQERMMLAQLQERAYAAATRRWRLIHTLVAFIMSVALFFWVLFTTADLHVDGEEALASLLVAPQTDDSPMRIPGVGVFNVYLAVECVLVAARYVLDKASVNPPAGDVVQQLSMAAPGLAAAAVGGGAGGKVVGMAQSVQNMGFLFQLLVSDACVLLVVFGVGVVACGYKTGLEEVARMVEYVV